MPGIGAWASGGGGSITPPELPPEDELTPALQPFADGDYDDGYVDFFDLPNGRFDGTEVLVGSVRIGTPAIASIVAADDIILDVPDLELDDASAFANDKGYRITESDHISGALYQSAGPAGSLEDDDDPNLIVDDPDEDGWFLGDTIPLAGLLHVKDVAAPDSYDITPSTLTPSSGEEYTANVQAKLAAANAHRINKVITITNVDTAGPGVGDVTNATVRTDKNGLADTVNATVGEAGTTSHLHATDGVATGNSADIVVQAGAEYIDSVGASSTGVFSGCETEPRDLTGLGVKLIQIWAPAYGDVPPVADSESNVYVPRIGSVNGYFQLYECVNPTVAADMVFSTIGTPASYTGLLAAWYSGTSDTPDDDENRHVGAGNQPSGAVTTAEANELITVGIRLTTAGNVPVIDNGFTIRAVLDYVSGQSMGVALATKRQSAADTVNPAWTGMAGGNDSETLIASYKKAP